MRSLTSLLPAIAPILDQTPQVLYEKQRALVRMKMLPTPQGRGRGSGAEATPENVAMLIVAVMATDSQTDTDERSRKLAMARYTDKKRDRCPWTGATTFIDALAFVLSPAAPMSVPGRPIFNDVRVSRAEPDASIFFSWPKRAEGWSQFKGPDRRPDGRLLFNTELPNDALVEIRRLLDQGVST